MVKEIKAVDVDDILLDTMPVLVRYYNRKFGTNFRLEYYKSYNLGETWEKTPEEVGLILERFLRSKESMQVQPLEGAVEGMRTLTKKYDFVAVTSRPLNVYDKTGDLLRRYFKRGIIEIAHTNQHGTLASDKSKFEACRKRNIGIIIEDCLEIGIDAARNGMNVILLNRQWNRPDEDYENPGGRIQRVNNWQEIVEALK